VPTTRNLHSALNPAIKSLNYLNNILAKIEANNAGLDADPKDASLVALMDSDSSISG
jgi:branched-subunit amino acid aminotransferase/4-amino-4-deoxychorismate lyase